MHKRAVQDDYGREAVPSRVVGLIRRGLSTLSGCRA